MGVRIIEGLAADCVEALFASYLEASDAGLSSQEILALVEPDTREDWLSRLAASGRSRLEDRIMTPFSWVKRELELWWPLLESALPPATGTKPAIEPLIVQIDLAQFLMERFSAPHREMAGAFRLSRTPLALRYVHLLDSLARGIENRLAPAEVGDRLAAGVARPEERVVLSDIQPCLDAYRQEMLAHRILDQALVWDLFVNHLLDHPAYRSHLASCTRMLLVEALDEATPLALAAYEFVAGVAASSVLGFRQDGAQREYLGSDPAHARAAWPAAIVEQALRRAPGLGNLGADLQALVTGTEPATGSGSSAAGLPRGGDRGPDPIVVIERTGYLAMLEAVVEDLRAILETTDPADVAIVAPVIDPLAVFWLRSQVELLGHTLVLEAGSHRLLDHPPAAALVSATVLAVRGSLAERLARHEWLGLLELLTGADLFSLAPVADILVRSATLPDLTQLDGLAGLPGEGYQRLVDWVAGQHAQPASSLEDLFRSAFACVFAPGLAQRAKTPSGSRASSNGGLRELDPLTQLVDVAERFEEVLIRLEQAGGEGNRLGGLCRFLRSGAIAERLDADRNSRQPSLTLATASQFAQHGRSVDVQLWLDTSSPRWWKSDARELTNARVLRRDRPPGPYLPHEDQRDMDAKLGRILLACCARATREIRAYASVLDAAGREQAGGLADLLAGSAGCRTETPV